MKKLLSVLLAVVMVAAVFPLSIFAAPGVQSSATSDAQITSNVCSIWYTVDGVETKYKDYANLDAASDGLRDLYVGPLADTTLVDGDDEDTNLNNELYAAAGSPVIKLNGNFKGDYVRPNWATDPAVGTYITYDMNKVPTVVIDGAKNENENYTVTYGDSYNTQTFNHLAFYNLTVKNTNMVINSGAKTVDGTFCWQGNAYRDNDDNAYTVVPGESFTIFENCSIVQNSTSTGGSGCLFKMNGYKKFDSSVTADPCTTDKYNLILKDTTVVAGTGIGHQAHWGSDVNIELYNSTMTLGCKGGDNSNNNDALLKFYEAGVGRVYMDGTSKLVSKRENAASTVCLIRVLSNQKSNVTIELEAGATLSMENPVTLTQKTYIADGGMGKTTITDNGAVYSATATDVKSTINLHTISTDGKTHAWYVNGEAVTNPYVDATATAGVTFTHAVPVDPAEGNVAYIEIGGEKTYYATLGSAMNALGALYDAVTTENLTDEALWQAAGSPVINLYDDITLTTETYPSWGTATNYNANRVRTVVIKGTKADGTNALITSTVAGGAFSYNAYYNLTLENIDLNCTQGFALFWRGYNGNKSAKSTTTLNNCNITATGTTGEGLVFKVTGNQVPSSKTENYIINLNNTDVVAKAGVNAVFLFHHGCAGELNIDGQSSITHTQNRNSDGGDTMFMLGTNRKFAINVASGAKLSATVEKGKPTSTYANTYAMFRLENSNTYASADEIKNVINIADGATIELNAAFVSGYNGTLSVINNNNACNNNVINVGAVTLKTNAAAREAGTTFYNGAGNCDKGNILGLTVEGKLYNNAIALDSDSFVATPVFFTAADYDMIDGASLRTVYQQNGLRFTTYASDALLAKLAGATSFEFHTLIAKTEGLTEAPVAGAENVVDITSTKTHKGFVNGDKTYENAFHAALLLNNEGVEAATLYKTQCTARGYFTVTYADGTTATFYTVCDDNNVRSMLDVATALDATGNYEDNRVVQGVIAACATPEA